MHSIYKFAKLNSLRSLPLIVAAVMVVILLVGCGSDEIGRRLDDAEAIMESEPERALLIIDSIDSAEVADASKAVRARYALLKSMALDKNYVDLETFDVLQPAIDYYLTKGNADEKMRTLYYQGRIYQNNGDDDQAMKSFIYATDLKEGVTDSLTLARLYVAQGTLFYKQYKAEKFVENNLAAAELYEKKDKQVSAIRCYGRAANGETILDNKEKADSLISICDNLVMETPEAKKYILATVATYVFNYGSDEEIKSLLSDYSKRIDSLDTDARLSLASGYIKVGDGEKALEILSNVELYAEPADSLKFLILKKEAFEAVGDYKSALNAFSDYSSALEQVHLDLFSKDLLFAEEKHDIEITNLSESQKKTMVVWLSIGFSLFLALVAGLLYYRYRLGKAKRQLVEKENEKLKMEKRTAELELQRDKLSMENLRLEKQQLQDERDELQSLLHKQNELSEPLRSVIKQRLDMLNSLLAKELSNNDSYAEPYKDWISKVREDKKEFMESTRLALSVSHPGFIKYLSSHSLTEDEINYLCLYGLGLRGKDVGEYLQLKRHYNLSSSIRKKLGLHEHETNISLYVRNLMKSQ